MSLADRLEKRTVQRVQNAPLPGVAGGTSWGRAGLESEACSVRQSSEGTRNNTLNKAAFAAGQLVAGGEIVESDARASLAAAARSVGLADSEIGATLQSGITAGKAAPRSAPTRPALDVRRGAPGAGGPSARQTDHEYRDDDAPDSQPAGKPVTATAPRNQIEILEPAAIFAPLDAPIYVVDQVVRRGSLTQLVGYGGGSKTWMGLDMLIAVGAGIAWLGRFDVKQGRAVYLDYENGEYEMRRRAQALARGAGLVMVPDIGFACMPPVYMSDPKFGAAVELLAEGCSLLVVDTLKAANPGTDENDSNMRTGLDALRRVGEKTGCASLVLVHSKKTSGSVGAVDPREAGRGSSAIFDAADTVFHTTYLKGEPLRVEQTKARLGRSLDPFLVTISDAEGGGVRVAASDPPQQSVDRRYHTFENVVCVSALDCVRANPGASQRLLTEKLGTRPGKVSAALEHLQRNGAVFNAGTARAGRWFAK